MDHSSNSLAGALVDATPNVAPSIVTHKPSVVAESLGNGTVVETKASESLPEAQIPQSRNQGPTAIPRTQVTRDSLPIQPPSLPRAIPMNPPHATTVIYNTSAVPGDVSRPGDQPMNHNQLSLVPRRNFSNAISNLMQEGERQPQTLGFVQHYQPEASTSAPPRQSLVKGRLPREADRSRLAKDILKQLGKPNGSVPTIPTRREYKKRKKAEAETVGLPVHPSTEPMAEPSLPGPVLGQVTPNTSSANQLQENAPNESLSLGYSDQHKESTPDANGIEQDVDMNIHPSGDPLVSHPLGSPEPTPPQDPTPTLRDPEPAQGKEWGSTAENPPPEVQPSRWIGPPPDAEVIEISDDEGQPVVGTVAATDEPMEVDGEVRMGGAISESLPQSSLVGDDSPVAVEMKEGHTEEQTVDRRSSREPVVSKDIQLTEKKSQKIRPYVEVPPLPDYARQNKGKERAPVEAEDEEGLY
jgi:hypothetical protein